MSRQLREQRLLDLFRAPRAAAPPPHAPGDVIAEAREVSLSLGARPVLDGVSLRVRAGEVLALVGPNGAGKSTLLSVLAADSTPDGGELRLFGGPAADRTARELALCRSVLPQAATLSFPFTVTEVVRMGRAPWSGTPAEEDDDTAVGSAMAATEVSDFGDRTFSALSGGERARVALSRVLAQRAPLMLLDEPTAALDLRHQELVMRICRERAAAGDAVVVVVHDLQLAAAYAHRVAVLHDGRLAGDGPPADVLTPELVGSVYQHPVEILAHPDTGVPLILPVRPPR